MSLGQEPEPGDTIEELRARARDFQELAKAFSKMIEDSKRQLGPEEKDFQSNVIGIQRRIGEILNDYVDLHLVGGETCRVLNIQLNRATKILSPVLIDGQIEPRNSMDKCSRYIRICLLEIRNLATADRIALCKGRRLLSIDGGGVRGYCSLLVLRDLMKCVKDIEEKLSQPEALRDGSSEGKKQTNDERLPKDYFDLAGGTSTGGLIAIMLFRLGMSVAAAMEKYEELSKKIFKPSIFRFFGGDVVKPILNRPWYSGNMLESEVREILRSRGIEHPGSEMMMPTPAPTTESGCQMFVCAVTKKGSFTVNFRTYTPYDLRVGGNIHCTIAEAARATSAAPFYFPPMKIRGVTYWDGGLQNNNPICEVLAENGPGIPALVVSLGTGRRQKDKDFETLTMKRGEMGKERAVDDVADDLNVDTIELQDPEESWYQRRFKIHSLTQLGALRDCLTNSENKHRTFARVLEHHKVAYIRFNPIIEEDIGLHEYTKLDNLRSATVDYLDRKEVRKELEFVARILARKPEAMDPLTLIGESLPPDDFSEHHL